jgi:hypothetical protein
MSAAALETFLARLYTDRMLRSAFLAAPENDARGAGLDEDAVRSLVSIDREGWCSPPRVTRTSVRRTDEKTPSPVCAR